MSTQLLHVLYEHASGYALFKVKEFEEIGLLQPQVEESVLDLQRFNSIVGLSGFSPFKSGPNALDNINCISEGIIHEDLHLFLESNIPKSSKKITSTLGVGDPKLASTISEEFEFSCQFSNVVPEILRGIRLHFAQLIKGLSDKTAAQAQLGLGHSYSRSKVKFNVHRVDNMIIQSISLLDQIDKDVNTFAMRIREWYSYHFPELIKVVPDNYTYAKVAKYVGNRKRLSEDNLGDLEELVMDSAKAQAILDTSRSSMGMDISDIDLINIESFAARVIGLAEYRKKLHTYLLAKMNSVAPSLSTLIGEQVGARLISHAGSLTNLAKYPASTLQILGAEKALFRALKTKGNTPKYGLIFHSTFIGRAGAKNKGRISRYLANKCSIASRIDCFSETPTTIFGEHLRKQVEDRLKFYETGDTPLKNEDVMKLAIAEAADVAAELIKKDKKKKKKKQKEDNNISAISDADTSQVEDDSVMVTTNIETKDEMEVCDEESQQSGSEPMDSEVSSKKAKKKKSKSNAGEESVLDSTADISILETSIVDTEINEVANSSSKKKKKRKSLDVAITENVEPNVVDSTVAISTVEDNIVDTEKVELVNGSSKKKKRKSVVETDLIPPLGEIATENVDLVTVTKKKKKRKSEGVDNDVLSVSASLESTLDSTADTSTLEDKSADVLDDSISKPKKKKKKSKDVEMTD